MHMVLEETIKRSERGTEGQGNKKANGGGKEKCLRSAVHEGGNGKGEMEHAGARNGD